MVNNIYSLYRPPTIFTFQIADLKMSFEGEKSQLMRDFHMQKEYIITEHDKDIENTKDMHRSEIQALEARMKERHDKAEKVTSGLISTRIWKQKKRQRNCVGLMLL